MKAKNLKSNSTLTKTMLIVVGILVAILLTVSSTMFVSDNALIFESGSEKELADSTKPEEKKEGQQGSIISYKTVFHFFTENLPHINNK